MSSKSRINFFFFAATMWVYPDLFSYKDGIYRRSAYGDQSAKGFHSVRLIGWGEESFNGASAKYWIVANSWGKWWGKGESCWLYEIAIF